MNIHVMQPVGWGEPSNPNILFTSSLAITAFFVAAVSTTPLAVNHPRYDMSIKEWGQNGVKSAFDP